MDKVLGRFISLGTFVPLAEDNSFGFGGQGSLLETLVDLNYVLPTLQG